MTSRWASLALLLLLPSPGAAQEFHEFGLQGAAAFADRDFLGVGPGTWWRSGHSRFGVSLMPGVQGDSFALRGELAAHFILAPGNRSMSPYGGGGIAGVTGGGDSDGYLMLVIGVEFRPTASSGWALEAGLGGGFRVGAVWRWRGSRGNLF